MDHATAITQALEANTPHSILRSNGCSSDRLTFCDGHYYQQHEYPYYTLPLWARYEASRQQWMKRHAEYASLCAFHHNKTVAREDTQAAWSAMDLLLQQLRKTPEHLAAFGW